jgi:alpha-acetolactate decarboxylase
LDAKKRLTLRAHVTPALASKLAARRKQTGQMLDCRIANVTIKIHHTPEFELGTPGTEEFLKADLSRDNSASIQKVER